MNQLLNLMNKAKRSSFYLWLLNAVLHRAVPFNKPHGFKILKIEDNYIKVRMPYRRSNLNHLRGLHACGLATAAEYSTGVLLLSRLDPSDYRLIMQSLSIEFHYQGKTDGIAEYRLDELWLKQNALEPLNQQESVVISPEVMVHDTAGNHLCTATMKWQVKRWDKVKTNV